MHREPSIFNRLPHRIMLPFLVLFLVIGLITLLLYQYYINRLIDERITEQTNRVSRVLINSEFLQNPQYMSKLSDLLGADVMVTNLSGEIVTSTLSKTAYQPFLRALSTGTLLSQVENDPEKIAREVVKATGASWLLSARALNRSVGTTGVRILCLISPLADLENTKLLIRNRITLAFMLGLVFAAVAAYFISRSISRPIDAIVTVTGKIAEGNFHEKAPTPAVDELKRLATAVNTMGERLSEYEKHVERTSRLAAAGKVTAALAHEIRNPLSSIRMMVQLLRNRMTEDDDRQVTQSLLEEVVRIERLIGDMTNQIRSPVLDLSEENMVDIIEEIRSLIEPKLNHRKIELQTDYSDAQPRIPVDRDKIKQVIWNLVLNAMESMPGGGSIRIATRAGSGHDNYQIVIEDNGCGIPENGTANLFTPFYSTKPEGLGIGLSTSLEIMEKHGGSLTLENRDGGGARAVVAIPAHGEKA